MRTVAEVLQLPAPEWATAIDGEARSGITWIRLAEEKPLAEPDCVGWPRPEVQVSVERFDLIDRTAEGFTLTEGQLLFFVVDAHFDLRQAWVLYRALGELLGEVDPERVAR